ncbi:MAG: ABC transporter substrate-binding protein [Candidatus Omnitrophica bacterium]|nr:ABC transporter substrate-binding protein [Candidatus Omnitrophota bacterium]
MKKEILDVKIRLCLAIVIGLVILNGSFADNVLKAEEVKKEFKIGLAVLKDNIYYHVSRTAFVNVLEKDKDITVAFKLLDAYGDDEAYRLGLERRLNIDKVDLVFTTGTRSTLPAIEIVKDKDIPLVFTAVASPVKSGIVETLEQRKSNVTGTHCGVPAYPQVMTIKKIVPNVKTIGIVYTKDESNAEVQTEDFKKAASQLEIRVLTSTVSKDCKTIEEVAVATRELIGKVDVIVAHQDTSISRYGKGMIDEATKNNIPTYVSLEQLVSEGATFSLGIDFGAIGRQAGEQALRILKDNIYAGDIPVGTDKNYSLTINLSAAEKIGLSIPIQVLSSASKLIR